MTKSEQTVLRDVFGCLDPNGYDTPCGRGLVGGRAYYTPHSHEHRAAKKLEKIGLVRVHDFSPYHPVRVERAMTIHQDDID